MTLNLKLEILRIHKGELIVSHAPNLPVLGLSKSLCAVSATMRGIALAALVLAAGCDKDNSNAPRPAPEVGVVTVEPQPVAVTTDLPGRVNPFLVAEVRARVDGIILKRYFTEGSDVREGQVLFLVDPAPYQAALDGAEATLQKAKATLSALKQQAARDKVLVTANAVSRQDYANAVSAAAAAEADVAAGKAQVETATINLGYTSVRAPIGGRIGISQVTVGAYVQAGSATLLATIQQIDPTYVDVTQSIADLLTLRREAAAGTIDMAGPGQVKITLQLDDGSRYASAGHFQFSDITVDQGTGSVTLRAVFPNPGLELLPGMFVHAEVLEGVNQKALVVPEMGVTHDLRGTATALVVTPDNHVALHKLVVSRTIGTNWVVGAGLNPGDRVIVQGVQFVQPGMLVKPVDIPPPQTPVAVPGVAP